MLDLTITPFLGWADLRAWLVVTTLACLFMLWMLMGKAWRREPAGFIWRTFLDERGVPDGKLLAVCHALNVMTATMAVGLFTGRWPPYYVWITWDFIAVAGIFGAAYVSKKYYESGGSTEPHCEPPPFRPEPDCAPASGSEAPLEETVTAPSQEEPDAQAEVSTANPTNPLL